MVNQSDDKYYLTALLVMDKFLAKDKNDIFTPIYFETKAHQSVVGILENSLSSRTVSACYSILGNLTYNKSDITKEVR